MYNYGGGDFVFCPSRRAYYRSTLNLFGLQFAGSGERTPAFAVGGVGIGDDHKGLGINFLHLEFDGPWNRVRCS